MSTLKDVITRLEPGLFQAVTSLTVEDFNLLVSPSVFNSSHMNQAVFAFMRYEDASQSYTGIESQRRPATSACTTRLWPGRIGATTGPGPGRTRNSSGGVAPRGELVPFDAFIAGAYEIHGPLHVVAVLIGAAQWERRPLEFVKVDEELDR